jgi:hypothetical protein
VTPHSRRWTCPPWAAAAATLIVLLAVPARADVDGGVPSDAATAAPMPTPTPTPIDAAVFETLAPPPEPSPPPDLTLNETSATLSTTMAPAPPLIASEPEPPRPITRRLWFWLAISGAVVAASLVVIAAQNPSIERPECPPDYVCPK